MYGILKQYVRSQKWYLEISTVYWISNASDENHIAFFLNIDYLFTFYFYFLFLMIYFFSFFS